MKNFNDISKHIIQRRKIRKNYKNPNYAEENEIRGQT